MPRNHPQITICTVYHPTGADDWTLLNHIDQSVDYVRRHHPYTGVIIMGDFNKLKDFHLKRNHNLKQIVDIPTRGTATLDKIYTNLTDLYHRPVVIVPIGLSDHMVVVCTPSTSTKYREPVFSKTSSRNCRPDERARFVAALLLISWETLFHLPSCEQQLQFFNSTIRILQDTHLSRIKTHKATGLDEIPNWILHDYATILAPPVCAIFNSSIREGTVPALWKCADVRPVPKIRPPALIDKDLRPISLTPVLSKCLEKFMCTWIMDTTMDQIDPQQYWSIKGTSTVHSLVELVHKWKSAVETPGTIVRILLVDFSKTFDRVEHHIFMTKCASLVLPNVVIKWLTSFLCQRKQRVKIGSVKSEYITVNADVPQGTIFGPIGFLHHINDLQTVCEHIKYVDDCTICNIPSSGIDSSLQVAADEVGQWTASKKMALNYDKSKELRICFKKSNPDIALLTIDGRPIQQVNSTLLLGVTLSEVVEITHRRNHYKSIATSIFHHPSQKSRH